MVLSLGERSCAVGLLLAALGTPLEAAAQTIPVGSEFQVNTYTTSFQRYPSVAADADGDFVVVWQSYGSSGGDTSQSSIQGQRYASSGSAVGSQFQVNTYTTSFQFNPSVSADADGDFVVVWDSYGSPGGDTGGNSVQGQRYASSGSAVGSQFQVNTYTTGNQRIPAVAADADGDFVVAWMSYGSSGSDTSGYSMQARRYASSGSAVGAEFQVNTYTVTYQQDGSIAADADGDFVVVWRSSGSSGSDTSYGSIQGQRYASDGSAAGGEFQVNTYTTGFQQFPSVAADAGGDFVVLWQSNGSFGDDTSGSSIQGQRYASSGSEVGGQLQVNTYITNYQRYPSVAAEEGGGFVVAWESVGSAGNDTSGTSIQSQRYDSGGSASGSQFQVNTHVIGAQLRASVAAGAPGDFAVVWDSTTSSGNDTSDTSIQAQRFATALKVPSLSPAALAAAALLVCLAVFAALRRRG
jgi:hypothetical protein